MLRIVWKSFLARVYMHRLRRQAYAMKFDRDFYDKYIRPSQSEADARMKAEFDDAGPENVRRIAELLTTSRPQGSAIDTIGPMLGTNPQPETPKSR